MMSRDKGLPNHPLQLTGALPRFARSGARS